MMFAVIVQIIGDSVPSLMRIFATLGAMLIGGIGMYLAFDDTAKD